MSARSKGARGEREAVAKLQEWGFHAERVDSSVAAAGNATGVDVLWGESAPDWPLEVKRGKSYRPPAWAAPYLAEGIPVLGRADRQRWVLLVPEHLAAVALDAIRRELERLAGGTP